MRVNTLRRILPHMFLMLLQVTIFVSILHNTRPKLTSNVLENWIICLRRNLRFQLNSDQGGAAKDAGKEKVVIGILSNSENVCLRQAQRSVFIPRAKAYTNLDVKVFFILDERTAILDEEQRINSDIVFLNTSVHGWGKNFARKLHMWFKYVTTNFPDALLIGRMDDDVFTCTLQIFDRLNQVKHELLYYGYPTACPRTRFNGCVDEMFLVIGVDLARRVTRRNFCDVVNETWCLGDTGNGGHMFRRWINVYADYVFVDEKANDKMIWFYFKSKNQSEYKKYMTPLFCERYLLFHKATPSEIYRWNQYNSLLLGDGLMANVSEKEIIDADTCDT